MVWPEVSLEDVQKGFIAAWQEERTSFTVLCQRFGISRKTGYKRLARFQAVGWEGLGDRSRAPHRHPNQTPVDQATQLLALKERHPTWGPKKLVAYLEERMPDVRWPAASTVGALLDRAGLVERRKRRRTAAPWTEPFAAARAPNSVWCVDLKGWFRTGEGRRADPLTVQDAFSRYLLVCHGLERPTGAQVRPVLERAFREYGLPEVLRSDNGAPFASVGLGGLTELSVWWVKLGIVPERIAPGHPEQNGRLERLHRTLKAETARPPRQTVRRQQRAFDAFRSSYNAERPHEALRQKTPALLYQPLAPRPYPRRVASPAYGPGVVVRRVRTTGEIKWGGEKIYVSTALRGEPVGLVPEDDRYWLLQYGPLGIGRLDTFTRRLAPIPVIVLPMCPV